MALITLEIKNTVYEFFVYITNFYYKIDIEVKTLRLLF